MPPAKDCDQLWNLATLDFEGGVICGLTVVSSVAGRETSGSMLFTPFLVAFILIGFHLRCGSCCLASGMIWCCLLIGCAEKRIPGAKDQSSRVVESVVRIGE